MTRCRWKHLRRVVVFLLLGAIVNVAVAWGLMFIDQDEVEYGVFEVPPIRCTRSVGVTRTTQTMLLGPYFAPFEYRSAIPHESIFATGGAWSERLNRLPPNVGLKSIEECLIGWPCLGLRSITVRSDVSEKGGWHSVVEHDVGLAMPMVGYQSGGPGILPLGLIWPDFAINTIFYTGILWMLFVFPFAVRRRVRIRRGLCPACAYPVGTSDVCTECGLGLAAYRWRNT